MTTYALMRERAEAAEARVRELEELCNAEDKRMEACDWFHQYREACIKIADMHDELEAVKAQNARLLSALENIEKARPALYDMNTLLRFAGIAGDIAKAALADGKAAP